VLNAPKVLFVSEGYGRSLFGVAQVLMRLASCCRESRLSYRILVAKAENVPSNDRDCVKEIPTLSFLGNLRWHFSQRSFLSEQITAFNPDLVHIHGVFTFVQVNAVRAANRAGIPILVSPHGMLETWLWRQKGLAYYYLKRLYWKMVVEPVIRQANFLHSITQQETETLRYEFPGVAQVRISNAIDISEYSATQAEPEEDRYLLFVGRLHPKKGIDVLINAFKQANIPNIRLIIAGPGFDVVYTRELSLLVEKLELADRVSFVGPIYGEEKNRLLRRAWATVVPSFSDVVALVNLESAANYTPTITTTTTGLGDWEDGGGVLVEPDVNSVSSAIRKVCKWSIEKRMESGKQAREFVEQRYSWKTICGRWIQAYRMIAEAGNRSD
jgi:glycosyltransferase involved in cell wall biosynthesis